MSVDVERYGEVIQEGCVFGIERCGLAVFLKRFGLLVVSTERGGKDVMRERVVGVAFDGFTEGCNGLGNLVVLEELEGYIEEAVELRGLRIDVLKTSLGDVDELGNVDGAVGGGGVVDDDGGRVVAVFIDVREHELRVRATRLG